VANRTQLAEDDLGGQEGGQAGAPVVPDPYTTPTLTVEEAGEILGLGRHAAYTAARTGELPTIRLGRKLLVPTAGLLSLVGLWDGQVPAPLKPAPVKKARPVTSRKEAPPTRPARRVRVP
jgi:excisionase family DNA binding protein